MRIDRLDGPSRRRSARAAATAWPALLALAMSASCGGTGDGDGATGSPGPVSDLGSVSLPTGAGSGQPRFAKGPDGALVLSWLRPDAGGHELVFSERRPDGWSAPRRVARGPDFFVNWADVPSVVPLGGGRLAAHWLERNGESPYAYGVRLALSRDGGRSWGGPVTPHADRSPTEHGFVSLLPAPGGGVRAVWLDGRNFASDAAGGQGGTSPADGGAAGDGDGTGASAAAGPEMTLRSAVVEPGGTVRSRALVDGRVCDCCQTSAAVTASGPLVVYRDRSVEEVRDIAVARPGPDGWSSSGRIHPDGWKLEACPVNGPAVDARGDTVAVAWFTAAEERPRVLVAHSTDGGDGFGEPVTVDGDRPMGRVDVTVLPGGDALVSWLGRVEGGDAAGVRIRRVAAGGPAGDASTVTTTSASRAGGFPRIAVQGDRVLVAWTDPSGEGRVRVAEGRLGGR